MLCLLLFGLCMRLLEEVGGEWVGLLGGFLGGDEALFEFLKNDYKCLGLKLKMDKISSALMPGHVGLIKWL